MLLIFLLLMVACRPGLALQINQDVSRERAKELGVAIRSNSDGENGVKVWLEFVPAGVLKNVTHVDLEIDAIHRRGVAWIFSDENDHRLLRPRSASHR